MENEEIGIDLNEEEADTEIIVEEKPKKSIKKKLLIAGGVVIGLVPGGNSPWKQETNHRRRATGRSLMMRMVKTPKRKTEDETK